MKCPNCGNENNDSAKFCKSCGASLKTDDAKIITHKKEDNNNTKIIIAVMAVVVILLAGVLLYTSGILNTEVELQNQEYKGLAWTFRWDPILCLTSQTPKRPTSSF